MSSTDQKIEKLGFIKLIDDYNTTIYQRLNPDHHFVHRVSLIRSNDDNYILKSEEWDGIHTKDARTIGLTDKERRLFDKRIEEKKSQKRVSP